MIKLCFSGILLLCILSCKDAPVTAEDTQPVESGFDMGALPDKMILQPGVRDIIATWPEFWVLDKGLDGLYRVENREELRLLLDELLANEKALAESDYPEPFNKPQIFSRQKVFKTYLLKTKASLEYQTDPQEPAREMLLAYNAYLQQFNILMNSKLDTELLIDD